MGASAPWHSYGRNLFTLEDETGLVNVVVWRQTFERHAFIGKTASLIGIRGELQVANQVTHLIATELYLPRLSYDKNLPLKSRDFH